MDLTWWQILLTVYIPFVLLIGLVSAIHSINMYDSFLIYTPKDFYSNSKMNWFGCVVVWLLMLIINPVWWVVIELPATLCIMIIDVFKYIFTVGRK